MNTFTFSADTSETRRDAVVIQLRRDGFSASRETDTIRTDATVGQLAMSFGTATVLKIEAGRMSKSPAGWFKAAHAARDERSATAAKIEDNTRRAQYGLPTYAV